MSNLTSACCITACPWCMPADHAWRTAMLPCALLLESCADWPWRCVCHSMHAQTHGAKPHLET